MLNDAQKAYLKALTALSNKDFRAAAGYLRIARNQFESSPDFRILDETTELLLAVKEEIFELEEKKTAVEENI